jgi:magnesium-transporting ATPase (P-type)
MNLNDKGKLATLYCWTYGKTRRELPLNLCPFFWKLVVATLIFPITWLSFPYGFRDYGGNYFRKSLNYDERTNMLPKRFFTGILGYGLLIFAAFLLSQTFLAIARLGLWQVFLNVLFVIGITLAVILVFVLCFGIFYMLKYGTSELRSSELYREASSVLKERKDGFMDSYCPKINWKE